MKLGSATPLPVDCVLSTARRGSLLDYEPCRVKKCLRRRHVVAGLPICYGGGMGRQDAAHTRNAGSERLLEHPVHAVIVQLEIHRLFFRNQWGKAPSCV